ncbi:MAG: hypothetical protein A3F14_06845 [Gammaproteobacteria bacterium RIFCSPHIGHO2_12_FULL_43_28]|nr:MAG: hypothetical protein A3F14_06845 [Gammaproteobacteria bacterium RIFCSPHIGHO2_12_FULL_43_28]
MEFDIVIVGGGMVGSALALLLAEKTPLSIAVLEASNAVETWAATHYHHRVSAINLASVSLFQTLKLWDKIKEKRVSPFDRIEVWDASKYGAIAFDSADIAEPQLGYIIENKLIQSALHECIARHAQIQFFSSIELVRIENTEKHLSLFTQDNCVFKTKLAVAADGGKSWLREVAGIDIVKEDYEQVAIVTHVKTEKPHDKTARQVFLPTGPLAFLPLTDSQQSSVVWSLPRVEAQRVLSLKADTFKAALTSAFSAKLGEVVDVAERFAFSLYRQYAKQYVKPRIALVGDAAHIVHPLAGLGVNMGFADVTSLVDVIANAVSKQRSFSSYATLRRYERWRKADNLPLFTGIDAIKRLFASDKPSLQQLRSVGFNLVNEVHALKAIFTQHAVQRP